MYKPSGAGRRKQCGSSSAGGFGEKTASSERGVFVIDVGTSADRKGRDDDVSEREGEARVPTGGCATQKCSWIATSSCGTA